MTTSDLVVLDLTEAHICGNLECSAISNSHDHCPRCTSQTTTLANIVENGANALAHEIARDAAITTLAGFCVGKFIDGVHWYDTWAVYPRDNFDDVQRAVRYLDACGVIRHAENNPKLVRWEEK